MLTWRKQKDEIISLQRILQILGSIKLHMVAGFYLSTLYHKCLDILSADW